MMFLQDGKDNNFENPRKAAEGLKGLWRNDGKSQEKEPDWESALRAL